jgi:hypothetical protein
MLHYDVDSYNLHDSIKLLQKCKTDRQLCQTYQYEVRRLTDFIERLTLSFNDIRNARNSL